MDGNRFSPPLNEIAIEFADVSFRHPNGPLALDTSSIIWGLVRLTVSTHRSTTHNDGRGRHSFYNTRVNTATYQRVSLLTCRTHTVSEPRITIILRWSSMLECINTMVLRITTSALYSSKDQQGTHLYTLTVTSRRALPSFIL